MGPRRRRAGDGGGADAGAHGGARSRRRVSRAPCVVAGNPELPQVARTTASIWRTDPAMTVVAAEARRQPPPAAPGTATAADLAPVSDGGCAVVGLDLRRNASSSPSSS